jgi:hypothetical protein
MMLGIYTSRQMGKDKSKTEMNNLSLRLGNPSSLVKTAEE